MTASCVGSASNASSVLGPDMTLDIDHLLDYFPEQRRDSERKEVSPLLTSDPKDFPPDFLSFLFV